MSDAVYADAASPKHCTGLRGSFVSGVSMPMSRTPSSPSTTIVSPSITRATVRTSAGIVVSSLTSGTWLVEVVVGDASVSGVDDALEPPHDTRKSASALAATCRTLTAAVPTLQQYQHTKHNGCQPDGGL